MQAISTGQQEFINKLIESPHAINVDEEGHWYIEGRFMRLVRWLLPFLQDRRLANVTHVFLLALEQRPVEPSATWEESCTKAIATWEKTLSERSHRPLVQRLRLHLVCSKEAREYRSGRKRAAPLPQGAGETINNIQNKKLHELNGHSQAVSLPTLFPYNFEELCYKALRWKIGSLPEGGTPAFHKKKKERTAAEQERVEKVMQQLTLTGSECRRLIAVCAYPELLKLLHEDDRLCLNFFKWTLRNRGSVEIFAEFPAFQYRIRKCYLASRSGYYEGKVIEVVAREWGKDLVLRCEGEQKEEKEVKERAAVDQQLSLLHEDNRVTLKGNAVWTVAAIFQKFSHKNSFWGEIEVVDGRLCNWNAARLGYWNARTNAYEDVSVVAHGGMVEGWWRQVPCTKRFTLEQAKRRYEFYDSETKSSIRLYDEDSKTYRFVMRNMSTRVAESLQMGGTHAYVEMAEPIFEGIDSSGNPLCVGYNMYTFGKSSKEFPHKWMTISRFWSVRQLYKGWEYAYSIASTLDGVIASPDPNVFASERQHAGNRCVGDQKKFLETMEKIAFDIHHARQDKMAYQILADNCAMWGHSCGKVFVGEGFSPHLYQTKFTNSEPEGFLGSIFKAVKKTPPWFQNRFFSALFLPLGGMSGKWVEGRIKRQYVSLLNGSKRAPWRWAAEYRVPSSATHIFRECPLWAGLHTDME
jgi:hypothetical protein